MKTIHIIYSFLFFLLCLHASGENTDSLVNRLAGYVQVYKHFSQQIPQENVYLHFDNTSYYRGDRIWFKCYVVNSSLYHASFLSKTLYVELLNPGGEIVEKKIFKIENGQCNGDFALDQLPFYSGFYEVRAYTKYMLNFGEEVIFSRLLPVFDTPRQVGNFGEKNMRRYGSGEYPVKRKKIPKGKKLNVKFFPEGGHQVQGITSRVAFEATDPYGHPVEITGVVLDASQKEVSRFATRHDGRGVFAYTPDGQKYKAAVDYDGKKYQFEMPQAAPRGFVMQVDNLSDPDSLEITLQKNEDTPDGMLGVGILSRGKLAHFSIVVLSTNEMIRFKTDQTKLLPGVSRIVLFDPNGKIVGDRLIFTRQRSYLDITATTPKTSYDPYEQVQMEFAVTNEKKEPVQTPFSVSVRDAADEVEANHNILTDLLLMSEIKGYVRNPLYYFEAEDAERRRDLDILLMVQGWRRYSWQQMAGIEPFDLKYTPEQGIEIHGQVVSFVRKVPKPDVEVSLFTRKRGENEEQATLATAFVTDSLGRFSFVSNVQGKWDMILAVTKGGKKKDYRIILDRVFSPQPRPYRFADLQVTLAGMPREEERTKEKTTGVEVDLEAFFRAYDDSLAQKGIEEKIHRLGEVEVVAKKNGKEKDIYRARLKSIAYYDVSSEIDDITDSGDYIGDDIHALMLSMNKDFSRIRIGQEEYLSYKGMMPLFAIDYERTRATQMDYSKYKQIRLAAIKSIYINENLSTICEYADPRMTPMDVSEMYSCVVLIETYPEDKIPTETAKGVRKTWLEGYSQAEEFYHPDYSLPPAEPDYRRTLYWNPSVVPDKQGKAHIQFYNNSRCRKFKVSAETITPQGIIGTSGN